MRLNQFISQSGYCSRRKADELIQKGLVFVDDLPPTVGQQVDETNRVVVEGTLITMKQEHVYLLLNKPKGITCTSESSKVGNIIDFVNYPVRIFPVGRLDKDSHGLIVLTSDGMIVNQLLRKENNHEKEYKVEVNRPISDDDLIKMTKGVVIYNPVKHQKETTLPCKIKRINQTSYYITLKQGLNRQIRRMASTLGYKVIDLERVRISSLKDNTLAVGKYRHLTKEEVASIYNK